MLIKFSKYIAVFILISSLSSQQQSSRDRSHEISEAVLSKELPNTAENQLHRPDSRPPSLEHHPRLRITLKSSTPSHLYPTSHTTNTSSRQCSPSHYYPYHKS
mmetsp:Transcript_19923/g.40721  ORF Transcript_19923/g.40721 Transcript_19923/m.40721 type:complete len:103 (-) Transcript_19923:501-809(-)